MSQAFLRLIQPDLFDPGETDEDSNGLVLLVSWIRVPDPQSHRCGKRHFDERSPIRWKSSAEGPNVR